MANIRPAVYYTTAGAVGGMIGSLLTNRIAPFWAWSIAGLLMAGIIFASNEKLRKNFVLGGIAIVAVALAAGGLATLIYRM